MSKLNISLPLYRRVRIPSSLRMTTVTLELEVVILESVKFSVTLKSSSFSDRPSLLILTSRHCINFVSVMLATKGASGAMKSIPPPADQDQTRYLFCGSQDVHLKDIIFSHTCTKIMYGFTHPGHHQLECQV